MKLAITARAWARVSNSSRQTPRSFSLENQDSIRRLGFGVAVAAAAMPDAELGEMGAERA